MIVLLNRFTVHGDVDVFEDVFASVSAYMADRPGFLGHRLLRETASPATYVNVAEWASAEALRAAVRSPEFGPYEEALGTVATSRPVLHDVVFDRTAAVAP